MLKINLMANSNFNLETLTEQKPMPYLDEQNSSIVERLNYNLNCALANSQSEYNLKKINRINLVVSGYYLAISAFAYKHPDIIHLDDLNFFMSIYYTGFSAFSYSLIGVQIIKDTLFGISAEKLRLSKG